MTLEIDEVDFEFVTQILCRAEVCHKSLMTDLNLCQTVRDGHRESAKMARQARWMMYAAKKKGDEK